MRHKGNAYCALIGLAIGVFSNAVWSLETLGVIGPVVDARPFYTQLVRSTLPNRTRKLTVSEADRIDRWSGFDAYDSGLQARPFSPRAHISQQATKLITPICLLANDDPSIAWLERTAATLKREKAICYLVKLRSSDDVKQLRRQAEDIPFIALNPAFLIEQFAVTGYPALISHAGVEQ